MLNPTTTNGVSFPYLWPLWGLLVSYSIHVLQSSNSEIEFCDGSNSYPKKHLLFSDLGYKIKEQESSFCISFTIQFGYKIE